MTVGELVSLLSSSLHQNVFLSQTKSLMQTVGVLEKGCGKSFSRFIVETLSTHATQLQRVLFTYVHVRELTMLALQRSHVVPMHNSGSTAMSLEELCIISSSSDLHKNGVVRV